jgi:hypothetical protein
MTNHLRGQCDLPMCREFYFAFINQKVLAALLDFDALSIRNTFSNCRARLFQPPESLVVYNL